VASPIPLLAPVTIPTLPFKEIPLEKQRDLCESKLLSLSGDGAINLEHRQYFKALTIL
jgi:hypothetical protein